jgi:hypothetical protein
MHSKTENYSVMRTLAASTTKMALSLCSIRVASVGTVVNFTPGPIYSRWKSLSTHRIWSWVGPRANPASYSRCCTLKPWIHSNLQAAPFNVHISNIIFIHWKTCDYSTYWEWQKGWRIVSYNWALPDGVPVRHEMCRSLEIKALLWF